jgi:glutaminase
MTLALLLFMNICWYTKYYNIIKVNEHEYKQDIKLNDFIYILQESNNNTILERAFMQQLAVSDFPAFKSKIIELFKDVRETVPVDQGMNAQYIPKLAKMDSNLFGISGNSCSNYKVCTIDGQRMNFGDTDAKWCVQSCIKPITYAMALEEHGENKVHQHIG